MAAAGLDEAHVEKKFRSLTQTQECIQSLTLWIIHHKAQHEKIVEIWFRVLKKSKMLHRLTMFYLCNDIVQTCKRKHAIIYKDAFKEILKDAVLLVRDNDVRNAVERIFNIWEERGVYDAEFIEEVTAILNNTKVSATMNSKLLAEFKPPDLMSLITRMKRHDDDVELRSRQISSLRLDASSLEAVKLLKDRAQGKEFCQQFEDSCTKLETFVSDIEKGIKERGTLIEMLEQSELFYDTQYGEAKIVANAYKNFGTRVNNLRKRLEEHKKTIGEPMSPVPSPSMDAPSPGNTPPLGTAEDIIESIDMELSDEDMEAGKKSTSHMAKGKGSKDKTSVTNPMLPPGLTTAEFLKQLQSESAAAFQHRGSDVSTPPWVTSTTADTGSLPWAVPPPPPPTSSNQSNNTNLVHLTEGSATPVNDEGSSTPVQDEKPDSSLSNPIEFLTQLINQSSKTQTGTTASFFESLSTLTKKTTTSTTDSAGTEAKEAADVSFDHSQAPPAPPPWEPWTTQAETPTPSYVPDTRPTPSMPFGEVASSQPYTVDTQPQNHSYAPDTQGHLYTESHPPTEPYTVDSLPPGQPYTVDPKAAAPPFSQPPPYNVEGQPPPPPFGAGPPGPPPPPPPNFVPDPNYVLPPDSQTLFGVAPPPPPTDPPITTDNSGHPPGHFPPTFYQEAPPQTTTPETPPESAPAFPPPSSWSQPFSSSGFAPPASSQPVDSFLPGNTSVSASSSSSQPLFSLPPGPPPDSGQFSLPPPGPPEPGPFNVPPGQGPPEINQFNIPPAGPGPQDPSQFDTSQFNRPPEPNQFNVNQNSGPPEQCFNQGTSDVPPFGMSHRPQDPPQFNIGQGSNDNNQFGMPPSQDTQEHHRFNTPPLQGPPDPPHFNMGQGPADQFNVPPPPNSGEFNMRNDSGTREQPPYNMQQEQAQFVGANTDPPPFNMPHRSGPPTPRAFDGPPSSPRFNLNSPGLRDPPNFNRRLSESGHQDSPFGRRPSSGHEDDKDFRYRDSQGPHNQEEGPPLRGILRHPRHNNLTTIQTQEFESPGSNSDQDNTDISSIPTMVGKGRLGLSRPPRPPSQPPSPQTPTTPGGRPQDSFSKEEDRQEFIEKLKKKKVPTANIPAAPPPKGILKNVCAGLRNLRNLTEIPDKQSPEEEPNKTPDVKDSQSTTKETEAGNSKSGEDKPADNKVTEQKAMPSDKPEPLMDMELDTDESSPTSKKIEIDTKPDKPVFEPRIPHHMDGFERRRSFDSPHRGDHSFSPYNDRRGGGRPPLLPPHERFMPRRPMAPYERFRNNFGGGRQPFPKRMAPRFDHRFQHFPRF